MAIWICSILYGLLVCCGVTVVGDISGTCQHEDSTQPYRMFSTRTSYDVIRGKQVKVENIPGCKPKQLYHLIRHGTRYPGQDEIESIIKGLPHLRESIIKHQTQGCLDHQTLSELRKWKPKYNVNDSLEIAPKGLQEMYELSHRMRQRFPELLDVAADEIPNLDLRYTFNYRSSLSAKYYVDGMLHRDAGPHDENEKIGYSLPKEEDDLLLYLDICYKYVKARLKEDDKEKIEAKSFDAGPEVEEILKNINHHLGLPDKTVNYSLLKAMFEGCRYDFAIYGEHTWCNVLPEQVMKVLEYRQDMKYYWRYGYGREVNYVSSCHILEDVMNHFSQVGEEPDVSKWLPILRFGHSRSILPLVALLGLFKDSNSLYASNFNELQQRQWQLANINPFSSNIAFILYDCDGLYKVRTFLNENEVHLPGCQDLVCTMEELKSAWSDIINHCDSDNICNQSQSDINFKDININAFHHA